MTIEERKRILRSRIIAAGALAAAAAGLAAWYIDRTTPSNKHMDPEHYFGISQDEAALVLDGELGEAKGRVIEGSYYLPYEAVAASINPSVFYEDTEDLLIVTLPEERREYSVASNGSSGGEAVRAEEEVFVSAPFLESVTNASFRTFDEPGRIVVSMQDSYPVETLMEDAPIRFRAGIKSPILKDGEAGTRLRVLDVDETGEASPDKVKKWTKVVTEDGFSGYVEDRFLGEPGLETIETGHPVGEYTRSFLDAPVNLCFHQTTDQASNAALTQSLEGVTGINVLAPTWLFLDGTAGEVASIASSDYVETAHKEGIKVWAVLNDFDGSIASSADTAAAMSSAAGRSAIVGSVMEELRACGADGLCLDIELVSESAAADFLELIREFSVECRKQGLTLSACNYVPTFTKYMNRAEQARVADYVIVMCYDEHTASSKEAGSVSSLPFVKNGITATAGQVPAGQVIAALPFFTRLWKISEDGSIEAESLGMSKAASRVEELGMSPGWDEETGQNYAETSDGGDTYKIWLEDSDSLQLKMEEVASADCAGAAFWKLGLESPGTWELIRSSLFRDAAEGSLYES